MGPGVPVIAHDHVSRVGHYVYKCSSVNKEWDVVDITDG
jgi:hypothetical protein